MKEFSYSIGGFFGTNYHYNLSEGKLIIDVFPNHDKSKFEYIDVPIDFDNRIISIVKNWKKKYRNNHILDGTQWSLKATFDDGTKIESFGSNEYPENFGELGNYIDSLKKYVVK